MRTLFILHLIFIFSLKINAQITPQKDEVISVNGTIENIQFLMTNSKRGEKTYHIYSYRINVNLDSLALDSIPENLSDIRSANLQSLSFITESSGLKSDLDKFRLYKKGDEVQIIFRELEIKKYINNETKHILIQSIKMLEPNTFETPPSKK
ncbi:MAG: hypothetical protein HRT58_16140 [Crocinitomicaceae bacterium]|nr:hypothetical protein [Flavobacteriales bacterium]NQZ37200.1 hypothetical protein [Crocinitomicaceae bacterium]